MDSPIFTKLIFKIRFLSEGYIGKYKVSALRGGMGNMLLNQYCVGNNNQCSECLFQEKCIVQNIMYSKYKIKPTYVTQEESMGYVMDCFDYREYIHSGNEMEFEITLFGDAIAFFNPILLAFHQLGNIGLGHDHVKYEIIEIRNRKNENVLRDGNVYLNNLLIEDLNDYCNNRQKDLIESVNVDFLTPCSLKYKKEFITRFTVEAVIASAARREQMLYMYEGIEKDITDIIIPSSMTEVQKSKHESITRYSSTKNKKMKIDGIVGRLTIKNPSKEILDLLYKMEITHIGKGTRFGMGTVRIRACE